MIVEEPRSPKETKKEWRKARNITQKEPNLSPTVRLMRLEVQNFRSIKEKTIIGPFDDLTSVMGPNGSGKSTILSTILFLLSRTTGPASMPAGCSISQNDLQPGSMVEAVFLVKKESASESSEHENQMFVEGATKRESESRIQSQPESEKKRPLGSFEKLIIKKEKKTGSSFSCWINGAEMALPQFESELSKLNLLYPIYHEHISWLVDPQKFREHLDVLSGSDTLRSELKSTMSSQEKLQNRLKSINDQVFSMKKEKRRVKDTLSALEARRNAGIKKKQAESLKSACEIVQNTMRRLSELEELAEINAKEAELENFHSKTRKRIGALQDKSKTMGLHLRELETKRNTAQFNIETKKTLLNIKKKEQEDLRNQRRTKDLVLAKLEQKIESLQKELVVQENEKQEILKKKENLMSSKGTSEELKESQNIQKGILEDFQSNEVLAISAEQDKLSSEQTALASKHSAALEKLFSIERRTEAKEEQISKLQKDIENSQRRLEELQKELIAKRNQLFQRETSFPDERMDVVGADSEELGNSLESELSKKKQLLSAIEGELEENRGNKLLRETVNRMKRENPMIKGVVRSLVRPTSEEFGAAIRAGLRSVLDHIVVQNAEAAKKMAEGLKANGLHRGMIILDNISEALEKEARNITKELRSFLDFDGPSAMVLTDAIQVDSEVPGLEKMVYVIGKGKVICDSIENGLRSKERWIGMIKEILTREGHILSKGSIKTAGLADRNRQTDETELIHVIQELREQMNELEKRTEAIRDKELAMKRTKDALKVLENDINHQKVEGEHMSESLEFCKKEHIQLSHEKNSAESEISQIKSQMNTLESRAKMINAQKTSMLSSLLTNYGRGSKGKTASQAEAISKEALSSLESKLFVHSTLLAQLSSVSSKILYLTSSLEKLKGESQKISEDIPKIDEASKETETAIEENQKELREQLASLQESDSLIMDLLSEKKENEKELKEIGDSSSRLAEFISLKKEKEMKIVNYRELQLKKKDLVQINQSTEELRGNLTETQEEIFKNILGFFKENEKKCWSLENEQGIQPTELSEVNYSCLINEMIMNNIQVSQTNEFLAWLNLKKEESTKEAAKAENAVTVEAPFAILTNNEALEMQERTIKRELRALKADQKVVAESHKAAEERSRLVRNEYKDKFMTFFNNLNLKLDQVLRTFRGWRTFQAVLHIKDELNVLDSGVTYSIQLPGKEFYYSFENLSGGEKALAEFVLYSGIIRALKFPFLLLDEMDKYYDGLNLMNYVQLLKKYTYDTQVLFVSHKYRAVAESSSVTGVYLSPETGSTQTITMKLPKVKTSS